MGLNILNLTRLVGESNSAYVKRVQETLLKAINDPNSSKSTGEDDCQCPICQLKRSIDKEMKKGNEDLKEAVSAVSEAAMRVASETETSDEPVMGHLLDNNEYGFSQALESMKNGYRVIRGNWPAVLSLALLEEEPDHNTGGYKPTYNHFAQFYTEEGNPQDPYYLTPYQFSQEDILATDWRILKYKI